MTLKDFIQTMKFPQRVELRDSEDLEICTFGSNSQGYAPYAFCEVEKWYSENGVIMAAVPTIIVNIKGDQQ